MRFASGEAYGGRVHPCVCSDYGIEDEVNRLSVALEQEQKKREDMWRELTDLWKTMPPVKQMEELEKKVEFIMEKLTEEIIIEEYECEDEVKTVTFSDLYNSK